MSPARRVLVCNAGSSSLKFEVFETGPAPRSILAGQVNGIGRSRSTLSVGDGDAVELEGVADAGDAAERVLERLREGIGGFELGAEDLLASGHRVVHGGDRFVAPVRVSGSILDELRALADLAPLHVPQALAVIAAVERRFPGAPAFAVFDTAFFADLPSVARAYALPAAWRQRYGIRRYGFHGIAHQCIAAAMQRRRAGGAPPGRRVVSLHLGQGCSMTALRDGRPLETSMGFTPLEGLVMGTRVGDVDAGVLLHLARLGHDWRALDDALNRSAGLLGLSGVSADMRELLELEAQGHAGAVEALAVFHHRIRKYLGAYAAVLGGIDAVAFGGGIGENSPEVRARVCAGLAWLGMELDVEANQSCRGRPGRIATEASSIEAYVVAVDEESLIAEAVLAAL